jgi:hypothetical protein
MLSITLPLFILTTEPAAAPPPPAKVGELEAARTTLKSLRAPPLTDADFKSLVESSTKLNESWRCKRKTVGARKGTAYRYPRLCARRNDKLSNHLTAFELYHPDFQKPRAPAPVAAPLPAKPQRVAEAATLIVKQALTDAQKTLQAAAASKLATAQGLADEAQNAPDDTTKAAKTKEAEAAGDAAEAALKAADAVSPELAEADAEAEEKSDDKSEAEKELDKLKAGKLIRWGITGGVGPAVYIPLHSARDKGPVPGVGAVTYIMFHPGYWRNAPAQNIYCANRWGGSESETAASRAADDSARARAVPIVDSLLVAQKAGVLNTNYEVTAIACPRGGCAQSAPQIIELATAANSAGEDATEFKSALTELVQRYTLDWRTGIAAKCGSRMVGFWAGYPLKYTATIPYDDVKGVTRRGRVDVTPLFAAGLGLSPNAYVSLLAGVAFGTVNLPPGTDKDDELVVSFLFGLGGNLDILGLLTK